MNFKQIFKLATIIAVIFVFAELPILLLDYISHNGFLAKFIQNSSLELMGTILALNLALAASLHAILFQIEAKATKDNLFKKAKKEINHNIVFLLATFFLHFLILAATPVVTLKSSDIIKNINYVGMSLNLLLFLLYLYAVYEMSLAAFSINGSWSVQPMQENSVEILEESAT